MTFTKGTDIAASEEDVSNTKHHSLVDSATTNNDGDRTNMAQGTSLVHVASSAPTANPTPINGHLWYDSTNNILMEYDGTAWLPVARGIVLVNRSGGALALGDVVTLDTGSDISVTTSAVANNTEVVGIVLVGAANLSNVIVITEGRAPTVNVADATAIGDYLFNTGVAGDVTSSSTNGRGSFGRALTSTAGSGTVAAQLGGCIFASGHSFEFTDTGSATFTRETDAGTGSVNYAHGLSVTPWMITYTFATATGRPHYGYGIVVIADDGTIYQTYSSQVHNISTDAGKAVEGACIWASEGTSATLSMEGAVSAVDGTNVTIDWTQTGVTAGQTINVSAVYYG
jgi:hypothetical protein